MASFQETFGMVYLEAMSQAMPIIYTKGQGIDGYFETNVPGFSVDPLSIEDIKEKILKIGENLVLYSNNSLNQIDRFSWNVVVQQYIPILSSLNSANSDANLH